jgi:hypothetical protein
MTSYYANNKEWFKAYYKEYYLNNRQKQIDKATSWYLASDEHRIRHRIACRKYLNANKKKVYFNRRIKSLHKTLMKELLDRFTYR